MYKQIEDTQSIFMAHDLPLGRRLSLNCLFYLETKQKKKRRQAREKKQPSECICHSTAIINTWKMKMIRRKRVFFTLWSWQLITHFWFYKLITFFFQFFLFIFICVSKEIVLCENWNSYHSLALLTWNEHSSCQSR